MITQVIDKDGKIYDLVYPENPMVAIFDEDNHCIEDALLSDVMTRYRPYKIDGDIVSEGLEPWERYGHYHGSKERWEAVANLFIEDGWEVSHNGQDMFVKKGDWENKIFCEVVFNHTPESIFRIEKEIMAEHG